MKYYLSLDFETSGLLHEGAQPVEFAAVILDKKDFTPLDEFQVFFKFDPERFTWSDVAEETHGYTREALEECGTTLADGWGQFMDWLSRWIDLDQPGEVMLAGHNVGFDVPFLAVMAECPPDADPMPPWACHTVRDSLQWAALIAQANMDAHGFNAAPFLDPETGKISLSLEAVAHSLGFDFPDAHCALEDARMVGKVMAAMISHLVEDLRNSRKYSRRREHIEAGKYGNTRGKK